MLDVAALAYQNPTADEADERPTNMTLEEKRRQLFTTYTNAIFERPNHAKPQGKAAKYTREQALHWLSWLAKAMVQHNQSVFYLE